MLKYIVELGEVSHLFEKKLPNVIVEKIYIWALRVEMEGLHATRKIPGLHDEPLKGTRKGQRSVRLSRSYRLIYIEDRHNFLVVVKVIEVNKHEY